MPASACRCTSRSSSLSERAVIRASLGGKAKINVTEELDAEAQSKGYISYKGEPGKVKRNAVSGGTIVVYEP